MQTIRWVTLAFLSLFLSYLGQAEPLQALSPEPILRLSGSLNFSKLQTHRGFLAFTEAEGRSLRVLNLGTQEIIEVSPYKVGPAYFWSPDGVRLIFRELGRDGEKIMSKLRIYDAITQQTEDLQSFEGSTGYPSLDPRSNTYYLVHDGGVFSQKLDFPTLARPRWQKKSKSQDGVWLATQNAILRLTNMGLTMSKLNDDGSGIRSFAISPDGEAIVWATEKDSIYVANAKETDSHFLGRGRDPSWHPYRSILVYSAARMIGSKIFDYDLRISDVKGHGRYILQTPTLAERWPQWLDNGTLLYTAEGSTDLLRLNMLPKIAQRASKPGQQP